jgi:tetratricopeptide (TPR) repeat protein
MLLAMSSALGQTPAQSQSTAERRDSGLVKLTGDDEKRAYELDEAIVNAMKTGHWSQAVAAAEQLLALRRRIQGEKHFEAVDASWQVKMLRRLESLPSSDRAAFLAAEDLNEQAESLFRQGKSAASRPLFEQVLASCRRLLTDDHPQTATSYNNLGISYMGLGHYAAAQPLFEKALSIRRRLLTDDHPDTAQSYSNLAMSHKEQGNYRVAQSLLQKALEVNRRLLTDEHPATAIGFANLAAVLNDQGRYAAAQPLFEQALTIRCRLLTDDHPDIAQSCDALAGNLDAQGKYVEAQALHEKALQISVRVECRTDFSNLNCRPGIDKGRSPLGQGSVA